MNGTVTGGWSFVWSAYVITALALGIYTVRAISLFRSASSRKHTRE